MDENGQLLHIDSVEHNGTNSTQPMRIDEDKVVSTINDKVRESERPYSEIGKLLLNTYFHGNPDEVRDKDRTLKRMSASGNWVEDRTLL